MRRDVVLAALLAVCPGVLAPPPARADDTGKRPRTLVPVQRSLEAARASNNTFRQPEELAYGGFHVLSVRKVRTFLPGAANGNPQEVEMLTYNGRLVGPTIRVRRGTVVNILVKNELPGKDADHPDGDIPYGFCTTNLHTHGLHVSPEDPSDNVFRSIPPGGQHRFTFHIRHDHPAGTFWYHAHRHGSVAYQLTNGMAGALIVDGDADDNLHDLEDLPEIAAARERVFVLQQFLYRINPADGVGRVDARDIYGDQPTGVVLPPGCETPAVAGVATSCWAINGVVMPSYEIAPGEVQRWRFIHAGREEKVELVWRDAQGNDTDAFKFNEIAVDGLATGMLTEKTLIHLDPGNRSDVLVKAPERPGVYLLMSNEMTAAQSLRRTAQPKRYLARVVVRGLRRNMPLPRNDQLAPCKPFPSVTDAELSNPGKPRVVVFDSNDDTHTFTVNGVSFSKQKQPVQLKLNTAEEWVIRSNRNDHLFHIHVNPFELILERNPDGSVKRSEWRDTIIVGEGQEVRMRTRYRDFKGLSVLHCHILDHEDQGMMQKIEFVGERSAASGGGTRAGPEGTGLPARPFRLSDAAGGIRQLSDLRGHPVILVFFRGMACSHCTQQLRELLQGIRTSGAGDVKAVAVSSERIAEPARALGTLGASGQPEFCLLVDEEHRVFRDYGCYDGGPQHGLFLIDGAGVIRLRYTGETPFAQTREVLDQIRGIVGPDKKALRR
jgi:FtsP/CotA-like multicopper oxidase with cupredoxin domain/peroxiredoxin